MTGPIRVMLFAAPLLLAPLPAVSGDPLETTPEAAPIPEEGSTTIDGARFLARIEAHSGRGIRVSLRAYNPGSGEIKTSAKVELVEMGESSPGERMEPEMKRLGQRTVEVELKAGADLGQEIVFKNVRLSPKRTAYLIKKGRLLVEVSEPDAAETVAETVADRS